MRVPASPVYDPGMEATVIIEKLDLHQSYLETIMEMVADLARVQAQHGFILEEHTTKLDMHTRIIDRHEQMLSLINERLGSIEKRLWHVERVSA